MAKERGLTNKQKLFVQEYLVDFNAYQAALRAGYCRAKAKNASAFLKNPLMKAEIDKKMGNRIKRVEITQDRIIQELAHIAFFDIRNLVEWDDKTATLKLSARLTPEQAAAVSSVTTTANKTTIKTHDKMKAFELLMRHYGMLNDKSAIDLTSSDGSMSLKEPIVIDMSKMTLQEIVALAKEEKG